MDWNSGFNPLLIGAAALPRLHHQAGQVAVSPFQSPSHRGGSAAPAEKPAKKESFSCFNPLLIGAAALPKQHPNRPKRRGSVSIPFSSGRQRCRNKSTAEVFVHNGFNPLLIGAAALPDYTGRPE